ncbi:MAG: DUF3810 domain-containing protein [Oscillospiraceae bacterium]|nr:DUF3810 domain-containing protein [Oscillospiraceae bacterium]
MRRFFLLLLPPALFAAAFYILRPAEAVMDFAWRRAGAAWRFALGLLTSYLPFSLMEVLGTALAVLLAAFLIALIVSLIRRRGVFRAARRLGSLVAAAAYGAAIFIWVYLPGYYAPPAYEGALDRRDISSGELAAALTFFRDRANELSGSVKRDGDGGFGESVDDIITLSELVYANAEGEFPRLSPSRARPKKMLYSEVMSRARFTGIYFALTGEANVNTNEPRAFLPFTAAHELAHSHGVAREDEANFFAVAACLTSGVNAYEYSGCLAALSYIGRALSGADEGAFAEISAGYAEGVRRDLEDNRLYWLGIAEQNARSPAVAAFSEAVNGTYDGYLKANGQASGARSYGECVDLLAAWALGRM